MTKFMQELAKLSSWPWENGKQNSEAAHFHDTKYKINLGT
jgi:hypothetical protein